MSDAQPATAPGEALPPLQQQQQQQHLQQQQQHEELAVKRKQRRKPKKSPALVSFDQPPPQQQRPAAAVADDIDRSWTAAALLAYRVFPAPASAPSGADLNWKPLGWELPERTFFLMGFESKDARNLNWPGGRRDYVGPNSPAWKRTFLEHDPQMTAAREFAEETADLMDVQTALELIRSTATPCVLVPQTKMKMFMVRPSADQLSDRPDEFLQQRKAAVAAANAESQAPQPLPELAEDVMDSLHWVPALELLDRHRGPNHLVTSLGGLQLQLAEFADRVLRQDRPLREAMLGLLSRHEQALLEPQFPSMVRGVQTPQQQQQQQQQHQHQYHQPQRWQSGSSLQQQQQQRPRQYHWQAQGPNGFLAQYQYHYQQHQQHQQHHHHQQQQQQPELQDPRAGHRWRQDMNNESWSPRQEEPSPILSWRRQRD